MHILLNYLPFTNLEGISGQNYLPFTNLEGIKKNFFVISPVLTKTYGERTFAHAAPIMWNNLPDSLRSLNSMEHFKSALKTYLFQLSLIS